MIETLDVNFVTRLGSGEHGDISIRNHAVFNTIDWLQLDRKEGLPIYNAALNIGPIVNDKKPKNSLFSNMKNCLGLTKQQIQASFITNTRGGKKRTALGLKWAQNNTQVGVKKFNLNFERLLKVVGKETWLPNWKQISNGIGIGSAPIANTEVFTEWNYESFDLILLEVGLLHLIQDVEKQKIEKDLEKEKSFHDKESTGSH